MKTKEFIEGLTFLQPQQHRHVVVLPIVSPAPEGPDYRTMDEALEARQLRIMEINESGSVPYLRVINEGSRPVLLLDGEEVQGAKQNRVLNTSILVPAHADLKVPVSCTEQGRWSYSSREFSSSSQILAHKIRTHKSSSVSASLDAHANFMSDQGEVWNGIAMAHAEAGVSSSTHALADLYQARERELQEAVAAFPVLPDQKGLLVLLRGEVAGMDVLSRSGAYAGLHPKLLRSYILGTLHEKDPGKADVEAALVAGRGFLREAAEATAKVFPAVGLGEDHRLQGQGVHGSALVVDADVIHAALFRDEPRKVPRPMASVLRRRQWPRE